MYGIEDTSWAKPQELRGDTRVVVYNTLTQHQRVEMRFQNLVEKELGNRIYGRDDRRSVIRYIMTAQPLYNPGARSGLPQ